MSATHKPQLAEAADRRWHLMAIAMFFLSVKSALSAAMVVADESYLRTLDWAEGVAALSAVAIVLWLAYYKLTKIPREQRRHFLNMEGFVRDTIHRAFSVSWTVTLVTLILLTAIGDDWLSEVPAEFVLQVVIAVMLAVCSIAYFVMNASGDEDEGVASA